MSDHTYREGVRVYAPLQFRRRSGGEPAGSSAFVTCPVCEAPMLIRRSDRVTNTVKTLEGHCSNTGCGATGAFEVTLRHLYNPGLHPDPGLPVCPREKVPQVYPPPRDLDDRQVSMFDPPAG